MFHACMELPKAALRDPVKFELSSIHNYVTKRLVKVFDDSTQGKIGKDEAPGVALGVKIGLALWERTAPIPRVIEPENATRPVNIAIVLQSPQNFDAGLPPGSLRVHLQGVNGDTGNGRVRDTGRREDLGSVRDDDRPRPEAS